MICISMLAYKITNIYRYSFGQMLKLTYHAQNFFIENNNIVSGKMLTTSLSELSELLPVA